MFSFHSYVIFCVIWYKFEKLTFYILDHLIFNFEIGRIIRVLRGEYVSIVCVVGYAVEKFEKKRIIRSGIKKKRTVVVAPISFLILSE